MEKNDAVCALLYLAEWMKNNANNDPLHLWMKKEYPDSLEEMARHIHDFAGRKAKKNNGRYFTDVQVANKLSQTKMVK
jgi:hypothetical protein